MKKSNLIIALTLLVVGSMLLTSCSSGKSCKKGGWYGDRNLSSVTPALETLPQTIVIYAEATCED